MYKVSKNMCPVKRKPKKNYKGLSAAEERRFRKQFTLSQSEIAECLGVDTRTIARWCRQEGLPFKRGAQGKQHEIELKTALHWSIGHHHSTKLNIELSSLETILFGLAVGHGAASENPSFSKWRLQMLQETDWFDATQQQITFAIGRLSAFGCLPFRQQQW